MGRFGLVVVALFVFVGIFAPSIAPYDPFTYLTSTTGESLLLAEPSGDYLFGTTYYGQDVLSQTIHGTRIALLIGLISAVFIGIGSTVVGIVAGYFGGWIDDILMRVVDVFMGIPTLPFAILVVALAGPSTRNVIFVIVFLFWRTGARVIRSSVMSLKERAYVHAARAAGASHLRIMLVHILPNVLPLAFLYVVFGLGWAVLTEASLSFVGLGDSREISWGQMLNFAFSSGSIQTGWWWVLPPSLCLILFLSSVFFIGRAYEEQLNPRLRRRS